MESLVANTRGQKKVRCILFLIHDNNLFVTLTPTHVLLIQYAAVLNIASPPSRDTEHVNMKPTYDNNSIMTRS